MIYYGAYNHADYSIDWGAQSLSGVNNTARLVASAEFNDYTPLYREYRLTGVKIQFYPISQVDTGATSTSLSSLWSCHQLQVFPTAAMADDTFIGQDNFKVSNVSRGYKSYINVGKYHKAKGEEWLECSQNYTNVAGTLLRLYAPGYSNGTVMGKVHTTFYVKLRGAIH